MVNSFVPSKGAELAPIVRKLGFGPITLINTHWHFDHTGGNVALAGVGAKIVAHETVRTRLGAEQYLADFELKVPPSPAAALPVVTIGNEATIYLHGEEIHLQHVAPATPMATSSFTTARPTSSRPATCLPTASSPTSTAPREVG